MHHSPQAGNRAAELTGLLNAAPSDPTDHEAVGKYIRQLAEAGLAVMLVWPGSKLPADLRTPQRRRADDKAAQKVVREAGRRDWQRVKSPAGLTLATTDTAVLDGYLQGYVKTFASRYPDGVPVNLAVETGGSRLVVIDCDTAAQLERFYAVAMPEGVPAENRPVPTVLTPGQVGVGGDQADGDTWTHRDGGHFWFTVPEGVELPSNVGTMTWPGDDGFAVLWDHRYALIPPSVRPEGAYTAPGEVHDLAESGWLVEAITDYAARRVERSSKRAGVAANGDMAASIDAWAEGVSWASILEPLSWTLAARADSCGCEVWTAPGPHASPKSATAHDSGCTAGRYTETNAPLHIWTDHDRAPFDAWLDERGTATLSKLQAVAAGYYDNDTGAAMDDLGIEASDIDAMVPPGEELPADFGKAPKEDDTAGAEDGASVCLPEEFWSAHPVLEHIRAFAHYGVNSADAVLGAALARLSAHLDPCVRVETGVKQPLPLNTFTGIVGSAGTGKSSAYHASEKLLAFQFPDPMNPDLDASATAVPPELPVGSGPGVAEAFMGTIPDPLDRKIKYRRQVRHKVLFHSDEGAGLVSGILDNKRGTDIGPTLRAAWTGAVLGQANASADRTREVRDYSLGLCVGFQLEALAALSTEEQLEYGTPQRFVYVSATDPTIPDEAPPYPGPLEVKLPTAPLRYDAELRTRARQEALARARGEADGTPEGDPMLAHRPALVARCAALLVVLCDPGRSEVHAADVALADMLLDTSARLHGAAMEWRREREAAERERQLQGRIREQVATAVALDSRDDDMARLSDRIVRYVDEASGGTLEWSGRNGVRKNKFDNSDRQLADAALARLTAEGGPLERDGNMVRRRS